MNAILGWEAFVGFLQMLILLGLYGLGSQWWRQPIGFVLMGSFAVKAVIFGMILAGRIWGPLGLSWWAIAMAAFDLVQCGWIVLLARSQRAERRRDRTQS